MWQFQRAADLNRQHTKEIYRWQVSIWKDAPCRMSSAKCKLKQWDATVNLFKWPKFRTLQHQWTCTLIYSWLERKMVQPLRRQFSSCFTKRNILLAYDMAITLLGIYQKELKMYVHTKIWMFIVTLFIIAKTWKQPRCPSVGEWILLWWSNG